MAAKKRHKCKVCGETITLENIDLLMAGPEGYKWVRHNYCEDGKTQGSRRPDKPRSKTSANSTERGAHIKD